MFGTDAAHACDEGFALVGVTVRICTSENGAIGVWSGDPSACERKLNQLMHLRAADLCELIFIIGKHVGKYCYSVLFLQLSCVPYCQRLLSMAQHNTLVVMVTASLHLTLLL